MENCGINRFIQITLEQHVQKELNSYHTFIFQKIESPKKNNILL